MLTEDMGLEITQKVYREKSVKVRILQNSNT